MMSVFESKEKNFIELIMAENFEGLEKFCEQEKDFYPYSFFKEKLFKLVEMEDFEGFKNLYQLAQIYCNGYKDEDNDHDDSNKENNKLIEKKYSYDKSNEDIEQECSYKVGNNYLEQEDFNREDYEYIEKENSYDKSNEDIEQENSQEGSYEIDNNEFEQEGSYSENEQEDYDKYNENVIEACVPIYNIIDSALDKNFQFCYKILSFILDNKFSPGGYFSIRYPDNYDSILHYIANIACGNKKEKNKKIEKLFELFIEHGASMHVQSYKENKTVLHLLVLTGKEALAKSVIKKDPDICLISDRWGSFPIHYVVDIDNFKLFKTIVNSQKHKLDFINTQNIRGYTVFHRAMLQHNRKIVDYLFSLGCNPFFYSALDNGLPEHLRGQNHHIESKTAFGDIIHETFEYFEKNSKYGVKIKNIYDFINYLLKKGLAVGQTVSAWPENFEEKSLTIKTDDCLVIGLKIDGKDVTRETPGFSKAITNLDELKKYLNKNKKLRYRDVKKHMQNMAHLCELILARSNGERNSSYECKLYSSVLECLLDYCKKNGLSDSRQKDKEIFLPLIHLIKKQQAQVSENRAALFNQPNLVVAPNLVTRTEDDWGYSHDESDSAPNPANL